MKLHQFVLAFAVYVIGCAALAQSTFPNPNPSKAIVGAAKAVSAAAATPPPTITFSEYPVGAAITNQ